MRKFREQPVSLWSAECHPTFVAEFQERFVSLVSLVKYRNVLQLECAKTWAPPGGSLTDSRNLSFVHFLLESVKNRFRLCTLIRLPNSAIFIAGATKKKKSQGPTKRKAAILDQFQDPNFDQPLLENSHQLSPIGNCDCYLISFLWVSLCPKTHESPFRGHEHPPLLKLPGHLSHLPVLPQKNSFASGSDFPHTCDRRALSPARGFAFRCVT